MRDWCDKSIRVKSNRLWGCVWGCQIDRKSSLYRGLFAEKVNHRIRTIPVLLMSKIIATRSSHMLKAYDLKRQRVISTGTVTLKKSSIRTAPTPLISSTASISDD